MTASGHVQPHAGVTRDVTGVFTGLLAGLSSSAGAQGEAASQARQWFCALGGRPRGPFAADEMVVLARKGKVRSSTLLWHAGADGWQPLRSVSDVDVAWLRDAVAERRQAEQRAQAERLARHGIVPIRLERRTVRAHAAVDDGSSVHATRVPLAAADADGSSASPSAPFVEHSAISSMAGLLGRAPLGLRRTPTNGSRWPRVRRGIDVAAPFAAGALLAAAALGTTWFAR
jgi:hypothetical protein